MGWRETANAFAQESYLNATCAVAEDLREMIAHKGYFTDMDLYISSLTRLGSRNSEDICSEIVLVVCRQLGLVRAENRWYKPNAP